jgi:hypothetical protein
LAAEAPEWTLTVQAVVDTTVASISPRARYFFTYVFLSFAVFVLTVLIGILSL